MVKEGGIFTTISVTHFAGSGPHTHVVPGHHGYAGEGQAWDVGIVWGTRSPSVHCVVFGSHLVLIFDAALT